MRGDTDFSQTKHLDRWDDEKDVRFIFGFDAHPKLVALAEDLEEDAYSYLERRPKYQIKTVPRQQPERVKAGIVQARGYETIHTMEEWVAEFDYRPVACKKSYRLIVVRKRLEVEKGQLVLLERYRYFFYITNDRTTPADEIVFLANDRCNQENLIAQLKGGVKALSAPVDNLVSNWAYMVMASLAWSLKAWSALLVPVTPRHADKHKAEKRTLLRYGVRDLLRGFYSDAVPDCAERTPVDLSLSVLEPLASGFSATGRATARFPFVLNDRNIEVGVWMLRCTWAAQRRKGREA